MKKTFLFKSIIATVAVMFALSLTSCKDDKQSAILVKSVTMNPTAKELSVGDSFQLEATVSPTNATDKTLIWSSSNDYVTVDQLGRIKAEKEGTAVITATAKDGGGAKAICGVTVKAKAEDGNGDEGNEIKVSSVTMVPTAKELSVGDSFQLEATVSPTNATDKTLIWSSNNGNVTVDLSGKIIAVKEGNATITAEAKDGSGAKATCEVTIQKRGYGKSSYYQWDAYESCDKRDTGNWEEGSSHFHPGRGVLAEQSCKDCCKSKTVKMYLSQDVYWDTEGPAYTVNGTTSYTTGLWVMKQEFIPEDAVEEIYKNTKKLSEENQELVNSIRNGGKYFFLPAAGCYKDGSFENVGVSGFYWLGESIILANNQANVFIFNANLSYLGPGLPCENGLLRFIGFDDTSVGVNQTSITLTATPTSIGIGEKSSLSAVVTYPDGTTKTNPSGITFISSNTVAVTVSDAIATGKTAGTSNITAKIGSASSNAVTITVKNRTNYKTSYAKSDYYQWDAYESYDKDDTGIWGPGSSHFHGGKNVAAEQSCKDCPTLDQGKMYLGAGVYWDDNGLEYTLPDGKTYTAGLWVKKSSKIPGFSDGSATKKDRVNLSDGTQYFQKGRPAKIEDYFFLPAAGNYKVLENAFGSLGNYWLSSESDRSDCAYEFGFSCYVVSVSNWEASRDAQLRMVAE